MHYLPPENRYDKMAYRRSGRSGLRLPAITLGLWYNFGGVDPLENSRAMIHRAFDLGLTHFDLANNYGPPSGSAEKAFGDILRNEFAGLHTSRKLKVTGWSKDKGEETVGVWTGGVVKKTMTIGPWGLIALKLEVTQ